MWRIDFENKRKAFELKLHSVEGNDDQRWAYKLLNLEAAATVAKRVKYGFEVSMRALLKNVGVDSSACRLLISFK
jgi:hypothetical protein